MIDALVRCSTLAPRVRCAGFEMLLALLTRHALWQDRWILSRLNAAIVGAETGMRDFVFGAACRCPGGVLDMWPRV